MEYKIKIKNQDPFLEYGEYLRVIKTLKKELNEQWEKDRLSTCYLVSESENSNSDHIYILKKFESKTEDTADVVLEYIGGVSG